MLHRHFFRVVSCCTLLHLNLAVLSSCIITIFDFFISQCFQHKLSWCTLFVSYVFSCCNVFMLCLLCTFFHVAPFFVLNSFHVANFFMLHYFYVTRFRFGPSLLTHFFFLFFVLTLFTWCPFLLLLVLSLRSFYLTLFHVALFSCYSFYL